MVRHLRAPVGSGRERGRLEARRDVSALLHLRAVRKAPGPADHTRGEPRSRRVRLDRARVDPDQPVSFVRRPPRRARGHDARVPRVPGLAPGDVSALARIELLRVIVPVSSRRRRRGRAPRRLLEKKFWKKRRRRLRLVSRRRRERRAKSEERRRSRDDDALHRDGVLATVHRVLVQCGGDGRGHRPAGGPDGRVDAFRARRADVDDDDARPGGRARPRRGGARRRRRGARREVVAARPGPGRRERDERYTLDGGPRRPAPRDAVRDRRRRRVVASRSLDRASHRLGLARRRLRRHHRALLRVAARLRVGGLDGGREPARG